MSTQHAESSAGNVSVDDVVALAQQWQDEAEQQPSSGAPEQLAELLKDERGLPFVVGFIDGVIRPEDHRVAARNWAHLLCQGVPKFLPFYLAMALRVGALAARVAPALVIPIATRALRQLVSHLVLDARPKQLTPAVRRIREAGMRPNINLLGEAILGKKQAAGRLQGTMDLLKRDDIDYVSIKVSSICAPHADWSFDETVEHVVETVVPIYQLAAESKQDKFINMDMEEYHDLDLTVAVFTKLLDRPELLNLEAGIVLQAYLPDALPAMEHLQQWAAARRKRGGARIKVRVVKGANLPMERSEAAVRNWPLAVWSSKQESDSHYKRVINYALHPEHTENVRIGVAGHNLFDLAWAWLLAGERGVREGVDFEMLLGMAPQMAEVVRQETGSLLLYTPVVRPQEFDVAISYLVRRLEEGATPENFMSSMFELDTAQVFDLEERRFRASLAEVGAAVQPTNRTQDRLRDEPTKSTPGGFDNTPDTDPSLGSNREWARQVTARVADSVEGNDIVAANTVTGDEVEQIITAAHAAGLAWGNRSAADRADILRAAAVELERDRGRLLEVMASECGKTIDQSDPEISEAIDFANYYADRAEDLERVDGADFHPRTLTTVTPPWNFPVAIPCGSTVSALAAGSAVIIKPAPQAKRCGSVMVDALWRAGVPKDALRLVHVDEGDGASTLITDERVDQVVLTGGYETAEMFMRMRPGLRLLAETSGKNAMIITPSADYDLAAKDLVASAFGHAGQKCSAASLAIVVGQVGDSDRFRTQVIDATQSLEVGYPDNARTQMGPIIEPASGKLLRALTELGPGESWLVKPRQLDESGRSWSPGVRDGVRPDSEFHKTEYFGPVLGVMRAETLEEAIELQNAVDYGLTAGLHSLDVDEQKLWLDNVQAGNVYINRGMTGAIVRRQPFGGWKRSAIGPGSKAGGPNYLFGLGEWTSAQSHAPSVSDRLSETVVRHVDATDRDWIQRALASDVQAWEQEYGVARDVSALEYEHNIFRYRPTPVVIRAGAGATASEVLRVVAAGLRAGAAVSVSAVQLDDATGAALDSLGVPTKQEADADFAPTARVRLVGESQIDAPVDVAVWDHPVTESGRLEMLPFLHEQAVSITNHRFGTLLEESAL